MKVVMNEKRSFVGTFLAYDRHLNLVLADCDEIRKTYHYGSIDRIWLSNCGW